MEFYSGGDTSNEAGTYSASTATLIEGGAQVNFTGTVNSVGDSLDILGVANFIPAVPTTLTTSECTVDDAYLVGIDNLVVTGMLALVNGILETSGTTDAEGGITITGAILEYGTLNNYGTAAWIGGTITADNGAVFNNESGATFDAQSDASFGWDGSGAVPTFNNLAGASFVKSGGSGPSGTQMSLVFNNAGAVDVSAGTLALGDSDVVATAISSGSFEGAPGTTLEFLTSQDFTATSSINADTVEFYSGGDTSNEAGTYSASTATLIEGGAQVNFTGTVNSVGDSLDILGVANFIPAVPTTLTTSECTVDDAYLVGIDNLVVTGMLTLVNGILETSGTTDAEGGITITGAILEYGTLNNYGTAAWIGGTITADNGAVFNNESGATFDAQSDASFGWDGSGAVPTFNNLAGASFVKSGGSGPSGTQMSLVFNNAGAVDVSAGTLALGDSDVVATAISSGSFEGAPGTTLEFLTSQDFTATSSINADTVEFYSGGDTSNEAGTYSASTATLIEGGAQVNFTGTVNSVGDSLDILGVANFIPAVPTTLTTSECTVDDAYLVGIDNLVVTGMLTLVNGILETSGTTDAEGGITITGAILEYGTLNNYGTAAWIGGTITADNGAVFNNESGATFDAQSDASFGWDGSGAVPTFNNLAGASFVKSGGSGPSGTQMSLVFNNAGAVDVSAGTLALGDSDVVATAISSGSFEERRGPRWSFSRPRISRRRRASTLTRWSFIPEATPPTKPVHTVLPLRL